MFLLHKAGLLRDTRVTTYWRALSELRSLKDVDVEEKRVVKSGKIWTSGGVSSGIDLALELIAEIAGKEEAGRVQLLFEYFPKRTIYCNLETSKSLPPGHARRRALAHGAREPAFNGEGEGNHFELSGKRHGGSNR